MTDPFATFQAECAALIAERVKEPAGYVFEIPPRKEMGQLACNVAFQLTRLRKNSPTRIAEEIVAGLNRATFRLVRDVQVAGPGFINFYLDERAYARLVLEGIQADGDLYGRGEVSQERRLLIEHTSVNPNKPWHIGHARNAVLGDTLARLYRFAGHPVEVQNYIDDTGKQVADMIFGLRHFGYLGADGTLTIPPGHKLDHFFGEVYARLYEILGEEPALRAEATEADTERARENAERLDEIAALKAGAEEVQHALESGVYRGLVHACLHAQLATAWRLNIYYDLLTWEQDIVRSGLLEEALTRIQETPAVHVATEGRKKGCLVIEMGSLLPGGSGGAEEGDEHSSEVVLVRSNGLPTYVGKDVGNHFWKYNLLQNDMRYALDTMQPNGQPLETTAPDGGQRVHFRATEVINLISSQQIYPQQVVAAALKLTGHGDIGFHHLAYGMVSARVGGEDVSMSGRRGTGVPTDDVLDQALGFALERVREKQDTALGEEEMRATAERVAAAAMRYVMVRYNALTDIVLDPAEMVEFEGNTGAYLLYAYTRAAAILRKAVERGVAPESWASYDAGLLAKPAESDLIGVLGRLPRVIGQAQETRAVHLLAEYGYEMATAFSQFYNKCPILNAQPPLTAPLLHARLGLVAATAQVMRNLYGILGLELVERL